MKLLHGFRRPKLWGASAPRGSLSVLPVVRAQLVETSRQIEDAVVSVCRNFTDIASRAREAVSQSTTLLDGGGSGPQTSVESSIETSRRTIASLLDRMERAAKLSSLAVSSMEEVSTTVTGIEELLDQVHRIAFSNKLVALNAKIEAVHVGELGSGFEVVADEISHQADQSSSLAEGIADRIGKMRARVDASAGDLRDFLAEDRVKLEQSRQEAEGALNMLWSLHQRTRESLESSTRDNARLAEEIAAAIIGLQFQDRVKQQVEHVVEALESLEEVLGGKPKSGAGTKDRSKDLLAEVQSSYTMESERLAHSRATDGDVSESGDAGVELF